MWCRAWCPCGSQVLVESWRCVGISGIWRYGTCTCCRLSLSDWRRNLHTGHSWRLLVYLQPLFFFVFGPSSCPSFLGLPSFALTAHLLLWSTSHVSQPGELSVDLLKEKHRYTYYIQSYVLCFDVATIILVFESISCTNGMHVLWCHGTHIHGWLVLKSKWISSYIDHIHNCSLCGSSCAPSVGSSCRRSLCICYNSIWPQMVGGSCHGSCGVWKVLQQ